MASNAGSMIILPENPRRRILACGLVMLLIGAAGLRWLALDSGSIAFLDREEPARWILYPKPFDGQLHRMADLETTFHSSFALNTPPAAAALTVRAMKQWTVSVNGMAAPASSRPAADWKEAVTLDIARQLHPGTNEIVITVLNTNGPPALWCVLSVGDEQMVSGPDWDCSLAGAAMQKAVTAEALPGPAGRSGIGGAELPGPSFVKCIPEILGLGVLFFAVLFGRQKWRARRSTEQSASAVFSAKKAGLFFWCATLLWLVLELINNVGLLPAGLGF